MCCVKTLPVNNFIQSLSVVVADDFNNTINNQTLKEDEANKEIVFIDPKKAESTSTKIDNLRGDIEYKNKKNCIFIFFNLQMFN